MPEREITITVLVCSRCTHEWRPRYPNPLTCPKCRSPYWRLPRREKAEPR